MNVKTQNVAKVNFIEVDIIKLCSTNNETKKKLIKYGIL